MTKVMTGAVEKKLKEPALIYFMLKFSGAESAGAGDHHFCAFGLDERNVVVAMGWQDIFTFEDWFRDNGQGLYKTENF